MKYFILSVFILLPMFGFSQLKNSSYPASSKVSLDSKILGLKSISKGMLCKDIRNLSKDEPSSLYILGKSDAGRYYMNYSPFGATFISSMLFPPAGLLTTIAMTISPPKEEYFGLPDEKLLLLSDQNYYSGYSKTARKKKILRSWGGFFNGTVFFYVGLRMFGYKIEDYL